MGSALCWGGEEKLVLRWAQYSRNACQEGGAALGVEGRPGHRTAPEAMHVGSRWQEAQSQPLRPLRSHLLLPAPQGQSFPVPTSASGTTKLRRHSK